MENKNIIIISVCTIILFLTLIISCSKGCGNDSYEKRIITDKPTNNNKKLIEDEKDDIRVDTYSSKDSSFTYSDNFEDEDGSPASLLSEEDKAELKKAYEEDDKIIAELKKEWMENKLKDPSLSPVAIEQYKLRSNPSFLKGMQAFEKKDFDTAIVSFYEILKDEKTTSISKYFACSKLMDIAMKKKDKDLYFIALRMRANMEEKEDLSLIGIERNSRALKWVDKLEYSIRAKDDPKYFEKCVKLRMESHLNKGQQLDENIERSVRKRVEKDIEFYSNKYKELLE